MQYLWLEQREHRARASALASPLLRCPCSFCTDRRMLWYFFCSTLATRCWLAGYWRMQFNIQLLTALSCCPRTGRCEIATYKFMFNYCMGSVKTATRNYYALDADASAQHGPWCNKCEAIGISQQTQSIRILLVRVECKDEGTINTHTQLRSEPMSMRETIETKFESYKSLRFSIHNPCGARNGHRRFSRIRIHLHFCPFLCVVGLNVAAMPIRA